MASVSSAKKQYYFIGVHALRAVLACLIGVTSTSSATAVHGHRPVQRIPQPVPGHHRPRGRCRSRPGVRLYEPLPVPAVVTLADALAAAVACIAASPAVIPIAASTPGGASIVAAERRRCRACRACVSRRVVARGTRAARPRAEEGEEEEGEERATQYN